LGDSPPADSIVKIVEKLATRENRVFVLHSEGGHASVTVPAFDVAAAAQFKLAHWAESATYLKFSHALERGEFTLATYRALTPDQRRGVKLAIGQAHHRQLAGARSELVSALHAGLPVAELVADAALRLSDNALFTLALEKGQAKFLHKQLALIPASFNATDGLNLLKTATRHAPLQSMALLLMANLDVSVKSSVIDFLLERLTDKSSTASAAATLARFNDTTVNNALGKLLHDDNDVTRRGAALALHFEGSDQATTILRNFVDLPGGDSVLKRDIAKWFTD
ncbi:MAG: HEAT repeat domain-containing protein, partial [Gammaproteobacteria bacterium]